MKKTYGFECWKCGKEFKTTIRRPSKCPNCDSEKIARQYTKACSSEWGRKTSLAREKYAKDLQQPYVNGKRNEHFDKLYPNNEVK